METKRSAQNNTHEIPSIVRSGSQSQLELSGTKAKAVSYMTQRAHNLTRDSLIPYIKNRETASPGPNIYYFH